MAEMHKKLIGIGDKPIWKKICIDAARAARCGVDDRQVEVIRDGEEGTFDIKLSNGKILDGVPSYELVLFERRIFRRLQPEDVLPTDVGTPNFEMKLDLRHDELVVLVAFRIEANH